jgi:uncharacterized protein (TIGR00299 family) protein
MGAAGDMIMSALFDTFNTDEQKAFLDEMSSLGLSGLKIMASQKILCGIKGAHIDVAINDTKESDLLEHHHHHAHHGPHSSLAEICHIIDELNTKDKIKEQAKAVFNLIAEAEAEVHGATCDTIHFHEVGQADAIADIVGSCICIDKIAPDKIIASPINTGSGFVNCMHGKLPVPAPATAFLLKGIPVYAADIESELCTPTGAALIKFFAKDFGQMPAMKIENIGYGMGNKNFEIANCLRAFIGNCEAKESDEVAVLECNLDDMTGEEISYACKKLLENGALDVYCTAIQMKKNRPAVLLSCICQVQKADDFAQLILKHTSTFGVRKTLCARYKLKREIINVETIEGTLRLKKSQGHIKKQKFEYDDISKIADEKNISFREALESITKKNS